MTGRISELLAFMASSIIPGINGVSISDFMREVRNTHAHHSILLAAIHTIRMSHSSRKETSVLIYDSLKCPSR
jgi:hypothetical protein